MKTPLRIAAFAWFITLAIRAFNLFASPYNIK
jgi:hypothetical protein